MYWQAIILSIVILGAILINPASTFNRSENAQTISKEEITANLNDDISAQLNKVIDVFPETINGEQEDNKNQIINIENLSVEDGEILLNSCNQEAPGDLTSVAVLAKYLDYNDNILGYGYDKQWPIASLTKLMTAVIALESLDQNQKVLMSEHAVISNNGTGGNFLTGETFKVKDLIRAMIIGSSNDSAVALSEALGEKDFIQKMQSKAIELNMLDTNYLDQTGLSYINQSTISDLNKLVNYVYKNHPNIFEISRQQEVQIVELKTGKTKIIKSTNHFTGKSDFLGGKTGYIDEAGRNLISIFEINNQKVLIITLGAGDAFIDTQKIKDSIKICLPSR